MAKFSWMFVLGIIAAAGSGCAQPVATMINSFLAADLGSTMLAVTCAMIVSTIELGSVAAYFFLYARAWPETVPPKAARAVFMKTEPFQFWYFTGGLLGVIFTAVTTILSPIIGSGMLFMAASAGELLAAALIDHVGFAGTPVRPLSALRTTGVLLPIAGCLLMQLDPKAAGSSSMSQTLRLLMLPAGVLAGMTKPLQSTVNRRLSEYLRNPLHASVTSVSVGSATTALIVAALALAGDVPAHSPLQVPFLHVVSGGTLGLLGLIAPIVFGKQLGMGLIYVLKLIGQLLVGAALDLIADRKLLASAAHMGLTAAALLLAILGGAVVMYTNQVVTAVKRFSVYTMDKVAVVGERVTSLFHRMSTVGRGTAGDRQSWEVLDEER